MKTYSVSLLHRIELTASTKFAAVNALHNRLTDKLHPRQQQLQDYLREIKGNRFTKPDQIKDAETELANLIRERGGIEAEIDRISPMANAAGALKRRCEEWIRQNKAKGI